MLYIQMNSFWNPNKLLVFTKQNALNLIFHHMFSVFVSFEKKK